MGRKSYEGTGILPGLEEDARPAPRKTAANSARTRRFSTPRLIATFVTAAVILSAVLFALHLIEQFLIMDPRFALGQPGDEAALQISGAAHASRPAIQKIFADDEGASVYLIPLTERRDAVREVP